MIYALVDSDMIKALVASDPLTIELYAEDLLDLYGRGLALSDQWNWIVREAVHRTGLPSETVKADLGDNGFAPTAIELADDEVCEAIVMGAVRRLDALELPHNHAMIEESYLDLAARIAARLDRIKSGTTPRDRALAEISFSHGVDAFVASRALAHLGRTGVEGGLAAVQGANLFVASTSDTEH